MLMPHTGKEQPNLSRVQPKLVPCWVFNGPFYYPSRSVLSDSSPISIRGEIDILAIAFLSHQSWGNENSCGFTLGASSPRFRTTLFQETKRKWDIKPKSVSYFLHFFCRKLRSSGFLIFMPIETHLMVATLVIEVYTLHMFYFLTRCHAELSKNI